MNTWQISIARLLAGALFVVAAAVQAAPTTITFLHINDVARLPTFESPRWETNQPLSVARRFGFPARPNAPPERAWEPPVVCTSVFQRCSV